MVLSALGKSLAVSLKAICYEVMTLKGGKKNILDFPFDICIRFGNKQWKFDASFYVYSRAQKYVVNSSFYCQQVTQK